MKRPGLIRDAIGAAVIWGMLFAFIFIGHGSGVSP